MNIFQDLNNAQGTHLKVVGQMSELIQEFEGKDAERVGGVYLKKKPDAIKNATEKILQKLKELISIKPHTYDVKASLPEHIGVKIIYYRKIDDGIEADYGEVL